MTKIVEIQKEVKIQKVIDYENGFFCNFGTNNSIIEYVNFYNEKFKRLKYIDDDILNELKNNPGYEHRSILELNRDKLWKNYISEEYLINFNEFDKLFYVEEHMLAYPDGKFINIPIFLSEIFFHAYENIETSEKECESILNSIKSEFILDKKIVEIPYYNQNEDCEDHFTLEMLVKIPESEYLEIIGNEEFMDDGCRKKVFAFLRK